MVIDVEKKIYDEIKDYCKLNNLIIKDFINEMIKKSFLREKYGDRPNIYPQVEDKIGETLPKEKETISKVVEEDINEEKIVYLEKPKKRKLN